MPNKTVKFFKTNALFICMILGILFHSIISKIGFITPYLLFLMLFITYCKVSVRNIRIKPLHLWLGLVQYVGCLIIYFILKPFDVGLAEGCMLCILAPTATTSPVIAGILGGSIAAMATYSILSNLSIAFIAPCIFSAFGAHGLTTGDDITFLHAFFTICGKVMPLLVGPFVLALILKKISPKAHNQLSNKQIYSFWLWAIALTIVMANTTTNLLETIEKDSSIIMDIVWVALGAAVVCYLQFFIGWKIGEKYHEKIVGGQGLGQKNTILAIWMANTFFVSPLVAIAPASYVVWQNLVNSYQLWDNQRKKDKKN